MTRLDLPCLPGESADFFFYKGMLDALVESKVAVRPAMKPVYHMRLAFGTADRIRTDPSLLLKITNPHPPLNLRPSRLGHLICFLHAEQLQTASSYFHTDIAAYTRGPVSQGLLILRAVGVRRDRVLSTLTRAGFVITIITL